jgi:hypothetical protein
MSATSPIYNADDPVLLQRDDLTFLDTRAMPWEDFSGIEGGRIKVLKRNERGDADIMMVWLPPGELPSVELPHRHVHRTVKEFSFMLGGELPHWEYASPEVGEGDGELVIFREGFFMERKPGSIHGLEKGPTPGTGCTVLMWRNGVGNWLDEPEAATETIDVPYPAPADSVPSPPSTLDERPGVVIERDDLTLLDTREMEWEDFPLLQGTRVKVLSRDENGDAMVFLVWSPPGELPSVELPHRHYHSTVHEYALCLSGDMPHWEYESAEQARGDVVVIREGVFMDRAPGSIHGLEAGQTSATGSVVLMWRDGVGTFVDEPAAANETFDVPFPEK